MDRRTVLAGAASVLCGCLARNGKDEPGSTQMDATLTLTPDDDPDDLDVDLTADIVAGFRETGPARVRITLTNAAAVEQSLTFSPVAPFPPTKGEHRSRSAAIFLVPADGSGFAPKPGGDAAKIPDEPRDGCWRAGYASFAVQTLALRLDVEPGEEVGREYVLLAHPDNEPCLPDGEYRVENNPVYNRPEATWGFALGVEREGG